MKLTPLLAVVAAAAVVGIAATDAQAFYHPRLGRFLQRDPVGYVDGMNLYEYVSSAPSGNTDHAGLSGGPRDAVRLHVRLVEASGTVEMHPKGALGRLESLVSEPHIYAVPESPWGVRVVHAPGWLKRGWHTVGVTKEEQHTSTSWLGRVRVWSIRPRHWYLQICPYYAWNVEVENRCCASGDIRVEATGASTPPAAAAVPPSCVVPDVPLGDRRPAGKVVLKAVYLHRTLGKVAAFAQAMIKAWCEP